MKITKSCKRNGSWPCVMSKRNCLLRLRVRQEKSRAAQFSQIHGCGPEHLTNRELTKIPTATLSSDNLVKVCLRAFSVIAQGFLASWTLSLVLCCVSRSLRCWRGSLPRVASDWLCH